ncbi:MAG: hypothetical protein Tsb0014_34280 [Pleurocapsa sp.]
MQEKYKQQVINFFNSRTAYDSEGDSHPKEAQRLLEYVRLQSGQTILDLATGKGLVAIPAAKAVASTAINKSCLILRSIVKSCFKKCKTA